LRSGEVLGVDHDAVGRDEHVGHGQIEISEVVPPLKRHLPTQRPLLLEAYPQIVEDARYRRIAF
jgi:hypothetical protein